MKPSLMSLEEARIILGEDAERISDECLSCDIEVARLFADIFFDLYASHQINKRMGQTVHF